MKDENMMTSDTVIGGVEMSLRKLLTSPTLGKDQVIMAKIKEPKRGRIVGRVALTARIEPYEIPKQTLIGTDAVYGYMDIASCDITGFKYNSGISGVFTKPKVVLDLGLYPYSLTHSFTHSFTHSLTHLLTYSLTLTQLRRYWYSLATEINTC